MSHLAQRDFIQVASEKLSPYFQDCNVLEIGSLNINGTVRDFFQNCNYIGLDVAPGKDVDVVCQGQSYAAPDNSFDNVISCEAMEHNPYWRETIVNMIRICRPGGLVLLTCATVGRAEHGTSRTRGMDSPLTTELGWDYYQNLTESDIRKVASIERQFSRFKFWINWSSYDLYFAGIKASDDPLMDISGGWNSMVAAIDSYTRSENSQKRCRYRAFFARIFGDRWFVKMRAFEEVLSYVHGR